MGLRARGRLIAVGLFLAVAAAPAPAEGRPPALREWQAKRVAYGYAVAQLRPGYVVVGAARVSRYRIAVTGNEPGSGPADILELDVTVTLVERRRYALWLRDPFVSNWLRWL